MRSDFQKTDGGFLKFDLIEFFRNRNVIALLWIIVVSTVSHILYSSFGFNPTDDGFILAYSRRLLDGEIPHLDFISIRPVLSPLIHVPEVFFGGDHTFWISRYIFFLEISLIAWFGVGFVQRFTKIQLNFLDNIFLPLIAFTFCCHSFPAMAWHTVDGLFLSVIGLYIVTLPNKWSESIGFFLMGLAYLCKQSFLFLAPGVLIIRNDWKGWKLRNVLHLLIVYLIPGIVYMNFLIVNQAFIDAFRQLLSQRDIVDVGLRAYFNYHVFIGLIGGVFGFGVLYLIKIVNKKRRLKLEKPYLFLLLIFLMVWVNFQFLNNFIGSASFALFGVHLGSILFLCLYFDKEKTLENFLKAGLIIGLLSWSVSLSIGYNYPVLTSGLMIIYIVIITLKLMGDINLKWRYYIIFTFSVFSVLTFHHVRTQHIYRDRSASDLTYSIGNVLPGGRNIYTNENTYRFLKDLDEQIHEVENRDLEFAILPSLAAYWVQSERQNPLPIDWAQTTELNNEYLLRKVKSSIMRSREDGVIILQKVRTHSLAFEFDEINYDDEYYQIVEFVHAELDQIGESKYFYLFK